MSKAALSRFYRFLLLAFVVTFVYFSISRSKQNGEKNSPLRNVQPQWGAADEIYVCDLPYYLKSRFRDTRRHSAEITTMAPALGVPNLFGEPSKCYTSNTRLKPFGYRNGYDEEHEAWWASIDWRGLQINCSDSNSFVNAEDLDLAQRRFTLPGAPKPNNGGKSDKRKWSRSAVVFRSSEGAEHSDDTMPFLRSMIVEGGLLSGGLIEVFVLFEIKNQSLDIFSDQGRYNEYLRAAVPPELQSITYLWSQSIVKQYLPNSNHEAPSGAVLHYPELAMFSEIIQPNFDFYWQFSMGTRMTGPPYDMLEHAITWAKSQPLNYLKALDSISYIPKVHGTWNELQHRIKEGLDDLVLKNHLKPNNAKAGVGQDADIINLDPIDLSGKGHTFFNMPFAQGRVSKRWLRRMGTYDTKHGHWQLNREKDPSDLKVVHLKHPIFYGGTLSTTHLDDALNPSANRDLNDKSSSSAGAIQLEEISNSLSWSYQSEYAQRLWRQYLLEGRCLTAAFFGQVDPLPPKQSG